MNLLRAYSSMTFLVACLGLTGCASVMRAPCDQPRISNRWMPAAYVVKLPFTEDESAIVAKPLAEGLDTLIEMQTIAMVAGIGNAHVTLLDARPQKECSISRVFDVVSSQRSGLLWRRPFHSAVFVWGDVFEQDGTVYAQTHMRMLWNGDEGVARLIYPATATDPSLEFSGKLPTSTITFPPRALTTPAGWRLTDGLSRLRARARPDLESPIVEMPRRFVVEALDEQWLRLSPQEGQDAWLFRQDLQKLSSDLLPELQFLHGVVAYLHYKVTGSVESAIASLEAVESFERSYPQAWQPSIRLPLAISDVIKGSIGQARVTERAMATQRGALHSLLASWGGRRTLGDQMDQLTADVDEPPESGYLRAAIRMPTDSDILTLSAMGKISACCDGPEAGRSIEEITMELERARLIDAANPQAAENLLNWYRLMLRFSDEVLPESRVSLQRRTDLLDRSLHRP